MFKLTPKRRELLGSFCLNLAVACAVVAMFQGQWWGVFPAILAILAFYVITWER